MGQRLTSTGCSPREPSVAPVPGDLMLSSGSVGTVCTRGTDMRAGKHTHFFFKVSLVSNINIFSNTKVSHGNITLIIYLMLVRAWREDYS